jgi:pyruvate ferredoxin oxidoreductase alpha subunit
MLRDGEGCHAVAEAIALCRPGMISAHADATRSRIAESLAELVGEGSLQQCALVHVESDGAAMSVAIGAAATGARTYAATTSQGLLFMAESVHSAAGLGLPIVMTICNCAVGVPATVWNDHTDSVTMRDAGWIQLYAQTRQEALDLHILAFRLAEALSAPVMVCIDGLMLAHAYGRVTVPAQAEVDAFLPPRRPRCHPGSVNPAALGAPIGPDAFMEQRYLVHHRQLRALDLIPQLAREFRAIFGRPLSGLLSPYRTDDAETIVVAMGSVNAGVRAVVDQLREQGQRLGMISICSFRPFPLLALRDALQHAKRVVVLERALAVGLGGILTEGVRNALAGQASSLYTVIAGLGGREIPPASLAQLFEDAASEELEQVTFLDLNAEFVARELEREANCPRPISEMPWN